MKGERCEERIREREGERCGERIRERGRERIRRHGGRGNEK